MKGLTAVVTGGGTGIGRAIATALAAKGVRVSICGRRVKPLERTVSLIREMGHSAQARQLDVSSESQVASFVEDVIVDFGSVDILVNNAGISGSGPVHRHNAETWEQVMSVNLKGPFLMARYVLPIMRSQSSGHIINISSESGLEHYPNGGAYGVSKHALNDLSEYIQRENQELGIRVDTICPGMVVTPMSEGSPGLNEEKCLYPEDIADLAIWLLTRRSNIKIGTPILIQTMKNPWE